MRLLLTALTLLALAGCGTDPAKLGITGPGQSSPPQVPSPSDQGADVMPGVTTMGTTYGPSYAPQTGTSGYWGYN